MNNEEILKRLETKDKNYPELKKKYPIFAEAFKGILRDIRNEAIQEAQKQKDDEIKENNCAWCPDCGDLLKIKQDKLNPNENWIYYCEGCDKEFEIVGRSLKQQLSDVNKIIDEKINLLRERLRLKTHCQTLFLRDANDTIDEVFDDELKSSLAKGDAHTQRTKVTEPLDKAEAPAYKERTSAPKDNDKFSYYALIGNIYENPELLEKKQ